jgi:isoamyl acetate esterase
MKLPCKIVCLGDSVTNNQDQPSYVNYWQELTDHKYGSGQVEVIAAGLNGETSYDGYFRLKEDVFSHRPDLVTIMYGHNDINLSISPRVFQYHMERLVAACRDQQLNHVWILTPNKVNHPLIMPVYEPYLSALKGLSQMTGAALINFWKLFADEDLSRLYPALDYLHPNQTGHRLMAERLMKQFKKLK